MNSQRIFEGFGVATAPDYSASYTQTVLAEVYKLALVRIWKTDLADQCAWFARCESEDADTDDVSGCSG